MHIEVDDGNFLDLPSILAQGVRGSQGNVVNETKAVGTRLSLIFWVESFTKQASVMPRWPCRTEGIPVVLSHYLIHSFDCSASGNESRLPSLLRRDRVLPVKVFNSLVARALQFRDVLHHLLNVVEVVDFEDVCDFCPLIHVVLNAHACFCLRKLSPIGEEAHFFVDKQVKAV